MTRRQLFGLCFAPLVARTLPSPIIAGVDVAHARPSLTINRLRAPVRQAFLDRQAAFIEREAQLIRELYAIIYRHPEATDAS